MPAGKTGGNERDEEHEVVEGEEKGAETGMVAATPAVKDAELGTERNSVLEAEKPLLPL